MSFVDRPRENVMSDVRDLLFPLDLSKFVNMYWELKPMHLARPLLDNTTQFLNLDDLEALLDTADFRADDVRLAQDGEELIIERYLKADREAGVLRRELNMHAVVDRHRQGATLILQGLQRRHPPLARLCRALSLQFNARVWANVYITPPNNQGFHAHYDTHDVFVLQIHGGKRWTVNELAVPVPLPKQPYQQDKVETPELFSTQLEAGALLYLPRGFTHQAATNNCLSVHVTIGLQTLTWADVLSQLVTQAVVLNPAMRHSVLHPGVTTVDKTHLQHLSECLANLAADTELQPAVRNALRACTGTNAKTLRLEEPEVTLERAQSITRASDAVVDIRADGGRLVLTLPGREIAFPLVLRPLISDLLSGREVSIADLREQLDEPALAYIAKILIEERLVQIRVA